MTRKLLSKVLGYGKLNIVIRPDQRYVWYTRRKDPEFTVRHINIHELAHKCKEWALNKEYNLLSYLLDRQDVEEEGYVQIYSRDGFEKTIYGKTEPEAIFKACEWILEQKEG